MCLIQKRQPPAQKIISEAAACESRGRLPKRECKLLMCIYVDEAQRGHVEDTQKENQMCVKCKQIKADLELRRFNRLHFFFLSQQ